MAKYINDNGDMIETNGSVYTKIIDGITFVSTDISKWSNNAEKWIDNDIAAGYYQGFKKVKENQPIGEAN